MITIRPAASADLPRNARPYAVIENVVTDPAFRRQGIGHAVLHAAQQAAWDGDCYKIMLATGLPGLVPFYEAAGSCSAAKAFSKCGGPDQWTRQHKLSPT